MPFVDGLRAVAALAVALFHFRTWLPKLVALLPRWVEGGLDRGYLGVQVFFVLSGFVIAHSLRNARYSLRFSLRFALRRQLRLDPPYWIVIALSAWAIARVPGYPPARISPPTILAHVAYLQNILGYPSLLDVFWTLAIEVQLYLAFVAFSWLGQPHAGTSDEGTLRREVVLVVTTLASLSLAWFMDITLWKAWFVVYWYMFALGVWTRYALEDRRARRWLGLFLIFSMVRTVWFRGPGPAVCVSTALLLYGACRSRGVARVLGWAPLAALGRISYSFYLLHALVGGEVLTIVLRTGPASIARDALALACALGAAIASATALYFAIEKPSMALSRAFADRTRPAQRA